jgi:hypothetical protein
MRFHTANTEAMRIDSSGNLLVGKTNQTANVAGTEIEGSGTIVSTRDNNTNMFLNRKTSDGNLIEFRKDNTVVGSIGTSNGDLYIGTGDTGLRFHDGDNSIYSVNATTGAKINGAIDLGEPAGRFKDLYLSGGVYLGGTGSANYLDDYEEGSLTNLSLDNGTATFNSATYTKIGRLVTIRMDIESLSDRSTASGLIVNGLPFTSSSTNQAIGATLSRFFNAGGDCLISYLGANSTSMAFFQTANSVDWTQVKNSNATSTSSQIYTTLTYETT